ncbi:YitT family protein [Brevibacillus sp. FSL K6-0770]|uniref:Putative membrane protein YczE n=2 Tax=Brevibacillus TaxID=55080 RepID=A0A4Y3PJT6_BREPA|nr:MULTISPECIES: YitT family protein [Brevibacillus]NRQ52015.1 YitT family protein [Brevibacillus sp. HD1.4A]MBU8711920.1 YitT family protein [Brevibacillus parabrevis]MDH6348982.1 putative membrane protein YczE [Brevibacillus sp. 1238]MDR5000999.1 YitT family protein [Brevibacillus parabrevis]MED2257741.1 YitT family protein [Brevibacillus parabrevis]
MSGTRVSKSIAVRYAMFVLGLFIGAFGCVLAIKANLGVAPWDTFHIGLQKTFGLTIGIWSQIVGVVVILSSYLVAKIKPTFGMFLNMICFGSFLDLILWLNIVPEFESFWLRLLVFLLGVVVMTIGIGMYLSPRLGAGPRDSFMLAMNERLGWSIQKVRLIIEVTVLIAGAALGGPVSIGTVLIAVLTGPMIQRTIPFWQSVMKKQYGLMEPIERRAS